MSPSLDPSSPEYKKAQRRFIKATKNRNNDVEKDWTPFRAAEKKFNSVSVKLKSKAESFVNLP